MNFARHIVFCYIVSLTTHLGAMEVPQEIQEQLFSAAENNDPKKIKELIEQHQVNINVRNKRGKTALCIAATRGKNEALKELLKHNPDVNLPDEDLWTPLKKAVDYGHLVSAALLLAANADPNRQDREGYTPLMNAYKNLQMTQLLVSKGADVNHRGHDGTTALYWAACENSLEVIQFLVTQYADDISRSTRTKRNAREVANDNKLCSVRAFACADFLNKAFGDK